MLPIHDENPSGRTPWVTYALIAACVLVFLYQLSLGERGLERFFYTFAVVPKELFADFARPGRASPWACSTSRRCSRTCLCTAGGCT